MASKLKDLSVEKIALVPEGDNKGADVLIYKRKAPQTEGPDEKSSQENNTDENDTPEPEEKAVDNCNASDNRKHSNKAANCNTTQDAADTNGGVIDMKIDKSKLTPEEQAQLDAIEKKARIPEETTTAVPAAVPPLPAAVPTLAAPVVAEPSVKAAPATVETPPSDSEPGEDIYKGLHPAIAAELESLRKWRDEAENQKLLAVAKKYEILGKKPEELVVTLKSLKAAGGGAYEEMITVLDASVQAVEQAGVFSEIGKNGHGNPATDGGAWAQIEKHAEAIQKAAPDISWHQALDKACMQHPELVHEYEENR